MVATIGSKLALVVAAAAFVVAVGGAANAADVQHGEKVYAQLCASCHGPYGRGDGPMASDLTTPPPDFTQSELLARRTDEQVASKLLSASQHTPMAVARVVKPRSMQDAIAYMRTLSVPGKHVSVLAGQDIYEGFCWYCHGMKGDGKGPAAKNIEGPKPRDFTSDKFVIDGREGELYQTITMGAAASFHGNEVMLEWGTKLSSQQVRDVIAYLRTFQQKK